MKHPIVIMSHNRRKKDQIHKEANFIYILMLIGLFLFTIFIVLGINAAI